jgi:PPP family 3-phenylpropionic acid transporter
VRDRSRGPLHRNALRAFYFLQFAHLGLYLPYFPLYLRGHELDALQIGTVMAAAPVMKVLLPPVWGFLADRTGARRTLTILTCAASAVAFALLVPGWAFAGVLALVLVYGVFSVPVLPLTEATTMEVLDRHGGDYGRIRAWGSVGFIVFSLAWGALVDRGLVATIVPAIAALFALSALSARGFPRGAPSEPIPFLRLLGHLRRTRILLFFGACIAVNVSHGPYYAFFTIDLVENVSLSGQTIGWLWALAVACEVGAMVSAGHWLRRMRFETGIALALAGATLRWLIFWLSDSLGLLILGQALHALSFALFHVCAVQLTHRLFPAHQRAGGQAMYSAATYGLGIALGVYGAGVLYDRLGAAELYGLAALIAAAGLLSALALRSLGQDRRGDPE